MTTHNADVAIVAISSNDPVAYPSDGPEAMATEAAEIGYTFPYLFDETQDTARAYTAACTPDFFLFGADRKLVYRGQFDSTRPGAAREGHGQADVRAALDALIPPARPFRLTRAPASVARSNGATDSPSPIVRRRLSEAGQAATMPGSTWA